MATATDPGQARRGPAAADVLTWLLLGLRVAVLLSVAFDVPHFPSSTAARFHQIAHTGGVPYRDFPLEYPIGELGVIRAVAAGSLGATRVLIACVALVSDFATYVLLRFGRGRAVALRYLALGTPLLVFIYRRTDLLAVALAVAGAMAVERGRERSGGALFAGAILTKLWPVVLPPALVVRERAQALRMTVVVSAVGVATWVLIGGPGAVRQVVSLRGAEGWEIESTVGAVVWPLTGEYRYEQGANRTGAMPPWARIALAVLLIAGLAAVWWRASRSTADPFGAPALAAVATLLVLSPVLSPQYLAWLVPWAAIASLDDARLARLATVPVVITGAVMTLWYLDVAIGRPANQTVMIVRNVALLVVPLTYLAARSVRRAPEGSLQEATGLP
jgi:hypothetical protein